MSCKMSAMIAGAIVAWSCGYANAQEKLPLGRSSVAKIMCAIYASESEDQEQNARSSALYLSGLQELLDYLDAFERGEFTRKQIDGSTPMLITLELRALGISRDFAAGKMASAIEREAVKDYSEYDEIGAENYGEIRPTKLWPIKAEQLYREKNCEFFETAHSIKPRSIGPIRAE